MKILLPLALVVVSATFSGAAITAVRAYDSSVTNANAVDSSATALTVGTFTTDVAAAYDAGTGGVITFDETGEVYGTPWSVGYGSGKTLTVVTTNGPRVVMDATSTIRATPISGAGYMRLTGNLVTTLDFTANPLSEFGFTLLARNTARSLDSITITYTNGTTFQLIGATALGANTANTGITDYINSPNSGPDIFFGYKDTTGLGIRSIAIDAGDLDGGNLIMDDFGFIVSPIPEPTVSLLSAAGLIGLAIRRKRA